ncbi:trichoplein keratin filament-binding protein-like isoform X2 [Planococcus citri]|uniref:trichoplein keratin filament-binding protein-like isoform X2 n=1 Tax=Planococcus citri TaxID=170843 RepID=UPI0031F740B5
MRSPGLYRALIIDTSEKESEFPLQMNGVSHPVCDVKIRFFYVTMLLKTLKSVCSISFSSIFKGEFEIDAENYAIQTFSSSSVRNTNESTVYFSAGDMEDLKIGIDRKTYRLKEESLARKRNQEYHKQLFWNDITNYYKIWDVQAAKYNSWASQPPTPTKCEDDDRNGSEQLEQRRNRLSRLLSDEFRHYEHDLELLLRSKNIKTASKKTEMRGSSEDDDCKASRNSTSSGVRHLSLEKRSFQESMKQCWEEQLKEKQMQKEFERKLGFKLEEETARQRLLEEQVRERDIRKRKEETKKLQTYLQSQIEEVKKRDELTQQIKHRERQDIQLKRELEEMAVRRNLIEKQRRSKELCSFLHHQYQMQLKQKTKHVQEELKEDQSFVEQLTRCLEQEELKNSLIREQARKEIDRANAVLHEYSRLEKQREKEMDFLFFEEAKKLWHKQETRWIAEQEARNNLMSDVLITLQKQIKDKLEQNAEQHSKLVEEKELLLKNIEATNIRLKETNYEAKEKQQKY